MFLGCVLGCSFAASGPLGCSFVRCSWDVPGHGLLGMFLCLASDVCSWDVPGMFLGCCWAARGLLVCSSPGIFVTSTSS